jgi:hypothetical protein
LGAGEGQEVKEELYELIVKNDRWELQEKQGFSLHFPIHTCQVFLLFFFSLVNWFFFSSFFLSSNYDDFGCH